MREERVETITQGRRDLLAELNVLDLMDAEYGGIRSMLDAAGKPVGGNDLLIAAHACTTGATIVTANRLEIADRHGVRHRFCTYRRPIRSRCPICSVICGRATCLYSTIVNK